MSEKTKTEGSTYMSSESSPTSNPDMNEGVVESGFDIPPSQENDGTVIDQSQENESSASAPGIAESADTEEAAAVEQNQGTATQERRRPNYTPSYIGKAAVAGAVKVPGVRSGSPFAASSTYRPQIAPSRVLPDYGGHGQMVVGKPGGGFVGYHL